MALVPWEDSPLNIKNMGWTKEEEQNNLLEIANYKHTINFKKSIKKHDYQTFAVVLHITEKV